MIQRIQTIFLFLATVFAGILFFTPVFSFNYVGELMKLTIYGVKGANELLSFSAAYALPLLLIAVLIVAIPAITIFMYKKRELQLKLSSLNIFLNAALCGLIFLYYASNVENRINPETVHYMFGTYIPLINMVLSVLAMRWVKKDIELLKSVDRLR
ncbi:MAG: DUF4293 domain-containing protein [Bacteroidales bacterium]|nr:DUF4293 domain-containing protein [Bacteroidales bacterium]